MAYQALYRKYRPRTFGAVIGQEHITTILKNQVIAGHIAHAYLFSGVRGTGKTTTARIFARAVNCLAPKDGEPCGECEACRISAAENADIIELDAASNSSVDDIRALVEKARYTPLRLTYKVYIIDEAHALASSSQAFNALLKTLEEPPAHVVFILATTEPRKLPATIRSRCQRLDFHRLRTADMMALMQDILQKSGAYIEEEGLRAIARAADGGMRDALSLADQCLAFCGDHVTAQKVYEVLGSMDGAFLFTMADALLAGDARAAMTLLDQVAAQGRDLSVFMQDITAHMRALLITKVCGGPALLECTEEDGRSYAAQCEKAGEARLLTAVETLMAAQSELRWLASPRARIECALVRIAMPEQAKTLTDLQARIELLEQKCKAGAPAPANAQAAPRAQKESLAQDVPPWADGPAAKEKKTDAVAAGPKAAPAPAAEAAPEGAQEEWKRALAALRTRDMALYAMAMRASAAREGEKMALRFDKAIFAEAMQKGQGVLEEILGRPVCILTAQEQSAEEAARALFGDALRIVD